MTRVRIGENASKWTPTETMDLGVLGIQALVEEYDELEGRIKRDVTRHSQIKAALKQLGEDVELQVNGVAKFQVRSDGQFMPAQFAAEYPALHADFLVKEVAEVFDLARFKAQMPALYRQFRAHKIVRVNEDGE